jgi:3',5'-cyclic AMP phosphodiesterase CpdA
VVLFSDTHIHADPAKLAREINMTGHLRQAVAEALALDKEERRPSMLIVNGDLAFNTGEAADYQNLVGLLRPIREAGWPVHLGMGNHDHRDRFWAGVPGDMSGGAVPDRPVESRQVLVLETPRADWVVLDSLDKTNSTPGLIGQTQLKWLADVLDEPKRREKPVLIMVHHHPRFVEELLLPPPASAPSTTPTTRPNNGILDTEALMDVLMPRRNAKALIFGHTHVWGHKQRDGLHLVNLPAVAYVFRPNQPSGWVDCIVSDGGARMTLRSLDPKHPKHGEVALLKWRA